MRTDIVTRTDKKQGVIVLTKAERRARILLAAEIFRRHGVTQDEVGAVVGASQPHVSRVLQGNLSRATKLSEEICLYAELLEDGGVTSDAVRGNVQSSEWGASLPSERSCFAMQYCDPATCGGEIH